jgi:DNA (cytosine-5)-methyltransferase 1
MSKDQNGAGISTEDVGYTLDGQSRPGVASFGENIRGEVLESEVVRSLNVGGGKPGQGYPAARVGSSVRRLTPLECERLQGFPDGWTDIPGNSDTQRYRQLGNAMAVPVVEWLFDQMARTP